MDPRKKEKEKIVERISKVREYRTIKIPKDMILATVKGSPRLGFKITSFKEFYDLDDRFDPEDRQLKTWQLDVEDRNLAYASRPLVIFSHMYSSEKELKTAVETLSMFFENIRKSFLTSREYIFVEGDVLDKGVCEVV